MRRKVKEMMRKCERSEANITNISNGKDAKVTWKREQYDANIKKR